MYKGLAIFDLDQTVINSEHRTPNKPDGTLDFNKYFELKTYTNVLKDTALPLINVMQHLYNSKEWLVYVCTARELNHWDHESFENLGVKCHKILSRNDISESHYYSGDAEYKYKHLRKFLNLKQFKNLPKLFWEDATPVLEYFEKNVPEITMLDAKVYNG